MFVKVPSIRKHLATYAAFKSFIWRFIGTIACFFVNMDASFAVKVFPTRVAWIRGSIALFLMSGKGPLPGKRLSTQITGVGIFLGHCQYAPATGNVLHVVGKYHKSLAAFLTGVFLQDKQKIKKKRVKLLSLVCKIFWHI